MITTISKFGLGVHYVFDFKDYILSSSSTLTYTYMCMCVVHMQS